MDSNGVLSDGLAPHDGAPNGAVRIHSWPVRLSSVLLVIQALGLSSATGYYFSTVDPDPNLSPVRELLTYPFATLPRIAQDSLIVASICLPLILMTLISAIGFIFLWRGGWVLTMMCQGLILFASLSIYFERPIVVMWPIYLTMAYSVLLVLYLNSSGVQRVFHRRERQSRHRLSEQHHALR